MYFKEVLFCAGVLFIQTIYGQNGCNQAPNCGCYNTMAQTSACDYPNTVVIPACGCPSTGLAYGCPDTFVNPTYGCPNTAPAYACLNTPATACGSPNTFVAQPSCGSNRFVGPACGCPSTLPAPACGCPRTSETSTCGCPNTFVAPASGYSNTRYIPYAVSLTVSPYPLPGAPNIPAEMSLTSDNLSISGPVLAAGKLPFAGTVALEGALPASGAGSVQYGCGDVAVLTEVPYGPVGYDRCGCGGM